MIGNLLEFSKLKAKKIEINKVATDVLENARNILKMSYFKSKEKENEIRFFVSNQFPKKVIADD